MSAAEVAAATTLGAALAAARRRIDRLDARLLVEHVSGRSHADLLVRPETPLAAGDAARLAALVARREAGEPLAYLVGEAEFRGLSLAVSPAVLIPRPETELLVELGVARAEGRPGVRILDLGTGSGAVAIALALTCPDARVTAVDRSPEALAVARDNGRRHGAAVRWVESDWFSALAGERFDVIVGNPPYIAAGDPHLALDGLPYEPSGALTDGGDGLGCLRAIVAAAPDHLAPDGWLLLEHGYDQAAACRALLAAAGFVEVVSWRDLAGIERVSGGRRPA